MEKYSVDKFNALYIETKTCPFYVAARGAAAATVVLVLVPAAGSPWIALAGAFTVFFAATATRRAAVSRGGEFCVVIDRFAYVLRRRRFFPFEYIRGIAFIRTGPPWAKRWRTIILTAENKRIEIDCTSEPVAGKHLAERISRMTGAPLAEGARWGYFLPAPACSSSGSR